MGAWVGTLSQRDADMFEKTQRQSARFICSNYRQTVTVPEMLDACNPRIPRKTENNPPKNVLLNF